MMLRICSLLLLFFTTFTFSCGHTCDETRLQVRASTVSRLPEFSQLKSFIENHSQIILDSCSSQLSGQPSGPEIEVSVWMNTDKLKHWIPTATPAEQKVLNGIDPLLAAGATIHYSPKSGSFQFDLPYATCGDTVFRHMISFSRKVAITDDPALRVAKDLGGGWTYFINSYVDNEPAVPPDANKAQR